MNMEQSMMKYPIGVQNFERLRRDGYAYVDKTDLVFRRLYRIGISFNTGKRCVNECKIA